MNTRPFALQISAMWSAIGSYSYSYSKGPLQRETHSHWIQENNANVCITIYAQHAMSLMQKKNKKFCLHLDYIMLLYNKTTIYNTPVQFCIKQLSVKKSHNDI